ncbi:MAG: helix-turn-helix transcriptional regulator [Clostridia bacterium]|nr:helix-turn-helix transcriptional regulator [Clostridia bacterium]
MPYDELIKLHATETLRRRLFMAPDIETFIKENTDDLRPVRLNEFLCAQRKSSGISVAEIVLRCNIDRNYLHQILNGTRKPSRDKLIQLAFGMQMDEETTQDMLKIAQMSPLYPRILRDAAILRCIHDKKSFDEAQEILSMLNLTPLDREETHNG